LIALTVTDGMSQGARSELRQ